MRASHSDLGVYPGVKLSLCTNSVWHTHSSSPTSTAPQSPPVYGVAPSASRSAYSCRISPPPSFPLASCTATTVLVPALDRMPRMTSACAVHAWS